MRPDDLEGMGPVGTNAERFNDVGPFLDKDGDAIIAIETDGKAYPKYVGQLWLGSTWLSVAEARRFRDWLNKVLP